MKGVVHTVFFLTTCVFIASCCLGYTKRTLPCKVLQGYTIQTIKTSCDINAIM